MPAYKTYMAGETVSSGDLVVLQTKKPIGGVHYYIRMSNLGGLNDLRTTLRALQIDNPAVVNVEEINAATSGSKTFWRMLLFQTCQDYMSAEPKFRAEDVVAFYHKEAEAYLHLHLSDVSNGIAPCFRLSMRTSDKARKKSSWMWKVESTQPLMGADKVRSGEGHLYRIKHVITNTYLKRNGEKLEVTFDYRDKSTLFAFKQFNRDADTDELSLNLLAFIRCAKGSWLTQVDEDAVTKANYVSREEKGAVDDRVRERLAKFIETDMVPERDALLVMPVRQASVASVVHIRRAMLSLKDYQERLQEVDDCADDSQPGDRAPKDFGPQATQVLEITDECYATVQGTLRRLVINCTIDQVRLEISIIRANRAVHICT